MTWTPDQNQNRDWGVSPHGQAAGKSLRVLVSVLNCSGTAGDSDGQLGKAGVPRPYSDPHLLTSSRLVAPRHAVNTGLAALPTRPAEVWSLIK